MQTKPRKPKKCKGCGEPFMPKRHLQVTCDVIACAIKHVEAKRLKKERAENRAAKLKLLDTDRRHWIKRATTACNTYIRERDKADPCISCGRHHIGQYHAGHYRPAGNNSAVRFHELNIHKQCSACNNHKSGNLVDYRINLIRKIGIVAVEWLEGPHDLKRWTVAELKAIEAHFKRELKLLLASRV